MHSLLFCPHRLCMNHGVNNYCFVHGQYQKREQKRTTKSLVEFHNQGRFLYLLIGNYHFEVYTGNSTRLPEVFCESSKLNHILKLYLLHKKAGSAIIERSYMVATGKSGRSVVTIIDLEVPLEKCPPIFSDRARLSSIGLAE